MSEHTAQTAADPAAAPEPTGVAEVDAVVASVAGLEGTAPAEQVVVFEQAHERLRRALDQSA